MLILIPTNFSLVFNFLICIRKGRGFPGSPVVKTPCFHYRGHGFYPWSGN